MFEIIKEKCENRTILNIKKKEDTHAFVVIEEDGKFLLAFAMCTYGHEDYKTLNTLGEVLSYIEKNEFNPNFGSHICAECYEENCI